VELEPPRIRVEADDLRQPARFADRAVEGDYCAERRVSGAERLGRRAVEPRLEMERVDVPRLECNGAVVVQLEPIPGRGVPSGESSARRCSFSSTRPSSVTRPAGSTTTPNPYAGASTTQSSPSGRALTSRRANPIVFTGPVPSDASASAQIASAPASTSARSRSASS
jgi:hypothetical protein